MEMVANKSLLFSVQTLSLSPSPFSGAVPGFFLILPRAALSPLPHLPAVKVFVG
jgi:hypothetical protein